MGPVLLLPTGSNDLLTADKSGAGPTAVAPKERRHLTYGVLGNHIWSLAGDSKRSDISSTFLQPFATYTWPGGWSATATADSTYDWNGDQWTIPLGFFMARVTRIGGQIVQFGAGPRYYAESGPDGAHDWGFRANVVLLFPK